MLRPLLVLATLGVAAFLLAPTVASLHTGVESLGLHRDLPWQIFRWYTQPEPPTIWPPDCSPSKAHLEPTVTEWPKVTDKNESFPIHGRVVTKENGHGEGSVWVEVFLNQTKEGQGSFVGRVRTDATGGFALNARVPEQLAAQHYHIVAHAIDDTKGCRTLFGGWSDPEMDVYARTIITFDAPAHPVVDQDLSVTGTLRDEAGGPLRNASVNVTFLGNRTVMRTDEQGHFLVMWHANDAGNVTINATFARTTYYNGTANQTIVHVLSEDVTLDEGPSVALTRSTNTTLAGHVYLAKKARTGPVTFTFTGVRVAECATCEPRATFQVTPDSEGNFTVPIVVLPPDANATWSLDVTGGGLKEHHTFAGTLRVPVTLTLDAKGTGLFSRGYQGAARAVDETGAPAPGNVTIQVNSATFAPALGADGAYAFQGRAPCGKQAALASYDGPTAFTAQRTTQTMLVCGILAYLPAWLLHAPWWIWPLALLALLALVVVARSLYRKHAPTLSGGPPLTVALHRQPHDDGPGDVVGLGERVELVATLDVPLPEGMRLRAGPSRSLAWIEPAGTAAVLALAPDARGDWPLRAEIVDAHGRVVTRRTITLRVVRYAEEIERRYRKLKRASVGASSDVVSPREFEAWLAERAPAPQATRLVGVFEEADYSPREASRAEFLAFLSAEGAHREAKRRAA